MYVFCVQHHLAENLIKPQSGKKWKTQNAGEKSAYVILEMDEAEQITGIDIGNEHSAFVEVLVGKSSCMPTDFKVCPNSSQKNFKVIIEFLRRS